MRNTFGNILTITTFGESHGVAIGGVIDGFPAGVKIDFDFIQRQVSRRRPVLSTVISPLLIFSFRASYSSVVKVSKFQLSSAVGRPM